MDYIWIMCTKAFHIWVSIDTLDWYPRSIVHKHIGWHSTNLWSMNVSWLTLGRPLNDCRSSVDRVSNIFPIFFLFCIFSYNLLNETLKQYFLLATINLITNKMYVLYSTIKSLVKYRSPTPCKINGNWKRVKKTSKAKNSIRKFDAN